MPETKKKRSERQVACPFCLMMDAVDATVSVFCDSDVGKHLLKAKREVLMAVRTAVDQCLGRLDSGEEGEGKGKRVRKVKVE